MSNAIYLILRKLKGYRLQDVLDMYIVQFYWAVEQISKELEEINKQTKKNRRKKGKKR